MSMTMTLTWIAIGLLYLLPTLVALRRHADSTTAIAVLNVLLGWTLVIWLGACLWALADKPAR